MAWEGGNDWKADWWLAGWGGGGGHAHAMKCSFFSWLLGCGMCCILRGRLSKCDSTLASSLPEQIACQHTHTYSHTHSFIHICTHTHTHVGCGRSERVGQLRPRAIAPSLSSPFRCQLSLMYPARSGHASCLWPASASSSSWRAKCFALRLIDLIWRQACAGAVSKNPKIDMLPRQKLKVEGQKEKDEQKLKIREILTLTFALLTARAAQWAWPSYCTFIKEKDAKSFLETPNKGYLYGFAEILIKNFRKIFKNLNWIKQARRIVRYQALMS